MNKNAIQRFAIWARTELISQVSQRAYQYDITADGYGEYEAEAVGGRLLTDDEKKHRQGLIDQIRHKGYVQVMEEVAYTWFNRFIALRYMEVNNYLPTHIRVFSDASGAFKPEILTSALHLDLPGLDMEKVSDLIEKNQTEDLYRYLLLTQCNALSVSLPRMFEDMGSYTELLLPNNILRQDGVLGRMVADIPEEDWTDQVQIIGWLYQYYNTELKDETFALLKKNVKITKERIPSATQLFTPDWIVRYMVENSLGRLWLEGHPDNEMKAGWKYYLDEAEQEAEVQAQLEAIRTEYRALRPQDIKVIDPCMGSGHILVYAFDVLVQIYKRAGFSERDAAQSILTNNLYGLDIDDRAAQLAYFAVMMKARQYDRRIFTRNIQPHVYAIVESNNIRIPAKWRLGPEQDIAETLVAELKDAKEYGSIINLSLTLDELAALRKRLIEIDEMSCEGNLMDMMESSQIFEELFPLVEIAETLTGKYDIVVTNPPYMGAASMGERLTDYVRKVYPETKSDLSTVFMERTLSFCTARGFMSMINIPVWMFITSYEKMRKNIVVDNTIINMIHLGRGVFGSDFGTTSFVIKKEKILNYLGTYRKLFDRQGAVDPVETKEKWFLSDKGYFNSNQNDYLSVPGCPIAYWVSKQFIANFEGTLISDSHFSGGRNKTHNNEIFTRFWWEVANMKRWQLYVKGGDFRRWYGNHEVVVDWSESAKKEYDSHGGLYNQEYSGKIGICWTLITSAKTAFRVKIPAAHYDSGAPTIFNHSFTLDKVVLGFLNSNVATEYLSLMNPTINMGNTYVLSLPNLDVGTYQNEVSNLVDENIAIAKAEWDSYELSLDFKKYPLLLFPGETLCEKERLWEAATRNWFAKMKANEVRLNEIFVKAYNLSTEIPSEVPDRDISVRLSDIHSDIRFLISYSVGCMFGRYSIYQDGLIYAGGEWDYNRFENYAWVAEGRPEAFSFYSKTHFFPDKDNIIPICDDEYFDDDITGRFVKWVEIVFGKETLEENLKYIADALGGKGTPREIIRSYFLTDYYADHLKLYKKRPIYWLFDSGKKNGFKALIYMHRYQSDLLARMRTDYVHEQQERYRTQLKHIGDAMDSASASERVKLVKQQKKLQDQALELQKYEEKVHHLADQNIKIDLDDGVVHNYELFADVLAKRK